MLRKLLNRLFGPFSSGGVIPLGEFLILLQKSYAYLRKHRYRVLSTELPDDLLQKWLMPMPDEKQAEEYKRSFARQNDTLSQTQLPVFVFDHVLQKRFNRDISTFDDAEMEIAVQPGARLRHSLDFQRRDRPIRRGVERLHIACLRIASFGPDADPHTRRGPAGPPTVAYRGNAFAGRNRRWPHRSKQRFIPRFCPLFLS